MGLKTTNYEIKELGITLPEAYAVLSKIRSHGPHYVAEFSVQTSREAALSKRPICVRTIVFDADRKDNLFEMAYKAAKEQRIKKDYNATTFEIEDKVVNMPFYGWENDIQ